MIVFKKIADLRKWIDNQSKTKATVGFVPTMGALHAGHISLINAAKEKDTLAVCSIFVNPSQFNDPDDFEKYPNTIETDIDKLEEAGCDVLFIPAVKEIYPDGMNDSKHFDLGYLETILEGKFRPGHFQGVCMVVDRLLDIVQPDDLFLGQKDYQQCMVIKRLSEIADLPKKPFLNICPTLREAGGLAMSSRNMRLSIAERKKALTIFRLLEMIRENIHPGDLRPLKTSAVNMLEKEGFHVDYVEIADAGTLNIVDDWDGKQPLIGLVAAFLNGIRLIDNLKLEPLK